MSVATKTKAARREAIKSQGYENNPPICLNCRHFDPPRHAVPKKTKYKPAICKIGNFAVHACGVCDAWTGKDGGTLE